jgi:hypothetical protein
METLMKQNRRTSLVLVSSTICLFSLSALAQQERVYETAQAVTGTPVQIGVFARANNAECKSGPLPEIRVLQPPEHGALTVKKGTLKTDRYPKCPGLRVNAQVLFYQSRANYVGTDSVAFEVTYDNGEMQAREISIKVAAAL